ncbi:U2 small nuclear ribonucleoprotein auxiliary factor 35 kDa subunit-related protein 2-like [Canis lupus baileyi]|uniref:U2 small nuclear ribonucleoprotein auxiliary factor 35 kDa subunit-related protein 2-like n=1 Tax=Canis lupus familiaris TaxID=9615 RepID=UPI0018F7D36D|nr:U2 small nuclear ribonucleoprotein auxiliary factor 35 kDa subunit-related protein 2-like [Canis lupus familiaris]
MAAPGKMMFPEKPSREKYRAALRKAKRKKRRQELARLRDPGPSQQEEEDAFTEEQRLEEKLLEIERQKLHEAWLLREQKAQEDFRRKKEREEAARKWREEHERKLREEWDAQQRRQRQEQEQRLQERRQREEAARRPLEQAGPGARLGNGAPWRNPEPPTGLRAPERDRADCPFYRKTGACRFGDRCSRRHDLPSSSPTLLVRSMFTTFGMEQCRRDDYDPDAGLEDSEEDTYQHFRAFYDDVLPEFRAVGTVVQFKVSRNLEPHLRGNVYVQYRSEAECRAALSLFNGRWYAGRRLQCELCPVTRWKAAICGLSELRRCPRGRRCNFLHVFRNPDDGFWRASRDPHLRPGPGPDRDRAGPPSRRGSPTGRRAGRREDRHGGPRRRRSPGPGRSRGSRGGRESERRSSPRGEGSRGRLSRSRAGPRAASRGGERGRGGGRGRGGRGGRGRGGRSRSSSGARSRGRRRPGSRDRTTPSPKGK